MSHALSRTADAEFLAEETPVRMVPNFSHGSAGGAWGGVNDRFAYGDADSMLQVYMTQFEQQLNTTNGVWLADSEHLMCQHLASHRVPVRTTPLCAARMRANGAELFDDFKRKRKGPEYCRGIGFSPREEDRINPCPPRVRLCIRRPRTFDECVHGKAKSDETNG